MSGNEPAQWEDRMCWRTFLRTGFSRTEFSCRGLSRTRCMRTRSLRTRHLGSQHLGSRHLGSQQLGSRHLGTRLLPMRHRLIGVAVAVLAVLSLALPAAAEPKIKIGVIFDLTGPLAGGGSELHYLGAKIMIDHFIKQGGVEGYQIEAVYADAQSKPDVAINEAVRLIERSEEH